MTGETRTADEGRVSFWSSATTRSAYAWLAPTAVVAALAGALAALARHEARVGYQAEGFSLTYTCSLTGHALAVVLVGAVAVSAAMVLARVRNSIATGAVRLGAVLGHMSLVTPVRGSLVAANFGDTVLWWHAKVQLVVAAHSPLPWPCRSSPSAQHGPEGGHSRRSSPTRPPRRPCELVAFT